MGRKRVDAITGADVLAVLAPIWTTTRMARQVRQRINAVMKWAVAEGYRDDNPAGDTVVAALPGAKVRTVHRRALTDSAARGPPGTRALGGGAARLDG